MRRRLLAMLTGAAAGVGALTVAAAPASAQSVWPAHGSASYVLGNGALHSSPHQHVVPIASVAKVMTAYLVLHKYPLAPHHNGFWMTVTARDVRDYDLRVSRDESVVPVRTGERLSEQQALAALLLPSANDVAIMLARKVSGSVSAFAKLMNATAAHLAMTHTHYTDPSGFDAHTVSTAADQTRLVPAVMRVSFFRWMASRTEYRIPVAGLVANRDTLLGHDGFVGIKTGSMSASGGCFMFFSHRVVNGKHVDMYGTVLRQPGGDLIAAGLQAAKRLVDDVAPHPAT